MAFGENLLKLRKSAHLTQEQLAQRLGTTKQSISRYEKGTREPNIRIAKEYAKALGVSLSDLVGEDYKNVLLAEYAEQSADLTPEEVAKVIDYIKYIKSQRGENTP